MLIISRGKFAKSMIFTDRVAYVIFQHIINKGEILSKDITALYLFSLSVQLRSEVVWIFFNYINSLLHIK